MSNKTKEKSIGNYKPQEVEAKWQEYWEKNKVFKTGKKPTGEKIYILDMFPYPSAEGLHVGHPEGYTATDIVSRYKRMRGVDVLHPMGWDAFGLPAENYALKTGIHPREITQKNIDNFRRQIKSLGLSYDWDREINTTDPEYYKWTQWIFLQLYKKGLAYEDEMPINWCPSCKTGLANEEVVNGHCDRCGHKVERKLLRQWILKITAYADRLLEDLEKLDWPESIKKLQRDWIGKKTGAEVEFQVRGTENYIKVFTTRLDTIFGNTFIVLAPEHELIDSIVTPVQAEAVKLYINQALNKSDLDREIAGAAVKTGAFTGAYAINPMTGSEVPIWIGDFVLGNVGTGAVMGVPAHDERDYEFAKAHDLPIDTVVLPEKEVEAEDRDSSHDLTHDVDIPFTGEGVLVDSGSFTGLHSHEARKAMMDYLVRRGEGKEMVTYKLRDWVFSRQRYWGEPIPVVHCQTCGVVPVPEKELPVLLPDVEKYEPTGTGESPLAGISDWVNVKCPKCNESAKRETNTMPQWAGSCWYYLRFIDPNNKKAAWDKKLEKAWMPVDLYVGGAEHAVLHLLYARFWHKVLFDLGHVSEDEPFAKLKNQGMILGEDGQKMSKSRGNVINPDSIVEEHGADTLRLYEMFMGPFEDEKPWNTRSMIGMHRFLNRVWDFAADFINNKKFAGRTTKKFNNQLQQTINKVTEDIEKMRFNTAIAALMEFLNTMQKEPERVSKSVLSTYVVLLSPFAPHIAEELWQLFGNKRSIQYTVWPDVEEVELEDKIEIGVQVNGKTRGSIKIKRDAEQQTAVKAAMQDKKVQDYVGDPANAKIIYIPGRILNFVVKEK